VEGSLLVAFGDVNPARGKPPPDTCMVWAVAGIAPRRLPGRWTGARITLLLELRPLQLRIAAGRGQRPSDPPSRGLSEEGPSGPMGVFRIIQPRRPGAGLAWTPTPATP